MRGCWLPPQDGVRGETPRRLRAAPLGGRGPCLTTRKSGQAPKLPLNSDNSMKPHSLQSAKCHHRVSTGDTSGERWREAEPREQETPSPFMEEGMGALGSGSGSPGHAVGWTVPSKGQGDVRASATCCCDPIWKYCVCRCHQGELRWSGLG